MPEYNIIQDSYGKIICGKNSYIGDVSFDDAIEGTRYTTKIKHYGNGYIKRYMANAPIFGMSVPKAKKTSKTPAEETDESETPKNTRTVRDRKDNIRRMAEAVHDIILLNEDLRYFFTLTINPEDIDSTDPMVVGKKVNRWLWNQTQRKGLKYILLPEYHPEKGDKKIHFHGLINDVFNLVDSGTRTVKGFTKPVKTSTIKRLGIPENRIKSVVYNVPEWKHGFTTAIEVYGSRLAIAKYVTKYVTKADAQDNAKIFGKYYWSSRSCIRTPLTELINDYGVFFEDAEHLKAYNIFGNQYIKYENQGGDLDEKALDEFLEMNPQFSDRLTAVEFIKSAKYVKSYDKIEKLLDLETELDIYIREYNARKAAEEERTREAREKRAAERRARRAERERQLTFEFKAS